MQTMIRRWIEWLRRRRAAPEISVILDRWQSLDAATRSRIQLIAGGSFGVVGDAISSLAIARELLAIAPRLAAVEGRCALESYVTAIFEACDCPDKSSKRGRRLRGRIQQLREDRLISRETAGIGNRVIEVGNAAAHGHPVNEGDVRAALDGLATVLLA